MADRSQVLLAGLLVAILVMWVSLTPSPQPSPPKCPVVESTQIDFPKRFDELKGLLSTLSENQERGQRRLEGAIAASVSKEMVPAQQSSRPMSVTTESRKPNTIGVPLPIEPLGPEFAFRNPKWREVGVENRDYLVFLPQLVNVDSVLSVKPGRKIYLDLGLSTYDSSIQWMFDNYPLKFDEIYGWEAVEGKFKLAADFSRRFTGKSKFFTGKFIGLKDNAETMNLLTFLDQLEYTDNDFVVMKMDVEGAEWELLPALYDGGYFSHIDEFMVEIHYDEPQLYEYGWAMFKQPKQLALDWMNKLRDANVYAHYWP